MALLRGIFATIERLFDSWLERRVFECTIEGEVGLRFDGTTFSLQEVYCPNPSCVVSSHFMTLSLHASNEIKDRTFESKERGDSPRENYFCNVLKGRQLEGDSWLIKIDSTNTCLHDNTLWIFIQSRITFRFNETIEIFTFREKN